MIGVDDGAGGAVTVTVVCAEADPTLLVAVNVYVVVTTGETTSDVPVTGPMPEMERVGVGLPLTDQDRTVVWPMVVIVDGFAVNEVIVGFVVPLFVVAEADTDWPETLLAGSNAETV